MRRRKRSVARPLLAFLLATVSCGCTGYARVHGHLRDKDGNPIRDARVSVWLGLEVDKSTKSDSDGAYSAFVYSAIARPEGSPGMEILHPDYERELVYFNQRTMFIGDISRDFVLRKKVEGRICIPPPNHQPPRAVETDTPLGAKLQVQLDGDASYALDTGSTVEIRGLNIRGTHELVVRRGSEVVQDRRFDFRSYKTSRLCFLYAPGQGQWVLWDSYEDKADCSCGND